ncbi:hypothetical protein Tco_0773321 [Tanacetum coccineum]|uniref:Uncharacterized protein n=1 Tax=Tanacetum coccineum TaxID=301880 RepID=A0ABQ4ZNV8_9ASTR
MSAQIGIRQQVRKYLSLLYWRNSFIHRGIVFGIIIEIVIGIGIGIWYLHLVGLVLVLVSFVCIGNLLSESATVYCLSESAVCLFCSRSSPYLCDSVLCTCLNLLLLSACSALVHLCIHVIMCSAPVCICICICLNLHLSKSVSV